jgi:hypothetical protein
MHAGAEQWENVARGSSPLRPLSDQSMRHYVPYMSQPQPELLLVLISSQVPKAPSEKAETGVTNKDVQLSLGPLSQAVSESQTSIFTCLRGPLFPNANALGHFAVETVCSWDHRRGPLRPGPAFLYLGWWISDY